MQANISDSGMENWHDYEVESRREIVMLLRAIGTKHQLVNMRAEGGSEVGLTTILSVDAERGRVILDRPPSQTQSHNLVAANGVAFDTTLDKIRIMFSANRVEACEFEGGAALRIALPSSLIRLQRREFYRMDTPIGNPVRAVIALPEELGGGETVLPLADISCGGVAILDNQFLLGETIGKSYADCKIDLPEIGVVTATLQVRSSQDMKLLNNKVKRRLGCQFVGISRGNLAYVQRYITKLEREQNARAAGLD